MINQLFIRNYALIDELSLSFRDGFTSITGETGAGKSIILGAMALALGKRADVKALKDSQQKCVVEIHIDISRFSLKALFKSLDIDYEENTILRREIQPSGKSRSFINDTPVKLNALNEVGEKLIDIHSQNDTLLLNNETYQLDILDRLAKNNNEQAQFSSDYKHYQLLLNELEALKQTNSSNEDVDYLTYLIEEIDSFKVIEGEEEELEQELNTLEHAEEIGSSLQFIMTLFEQEQTGVLNQLREGAKSLSSIATYNSSFNELLERLNNTIIELDDLSTEVQKELSHVEIDPIKLEKVRDRFNELNHLLHKHKVENTVSLKQLFTSLNQKLFDLQNRERLIASKEEEIKKQYQIALKSAKALTNSRSKVLSKIQTRVLSILKSLNIKDADFVLELSDKEELSIKGKDKLQFLFSANKGMVLQPIAKVASGGELSRLMLAIKSVLAQADKLPTIIFDEIDTGVSGDTAQKMAGIIKEMSHKMQVWAITHLPQIAAAGESHLVVEKTTKSGNTITSLREVTAEERVEVLAKMLSHNKPGKAAFDNARELLAVS